MTEKLKPCPFCGGKAKLEKVSGFVVAKCGDCGAEIPEGRQVCPVCGAKVRKER